MKKKVNASNSISNEDEKENNNGDIYENVNENKNVNTSIESNKIVIRKTEKVQPPEQLII